MATSFAALPETHATIDILALDLTKMKTIHTSTGADRNASVNLTNDLRPLLRESSWYNDMPGEAVFTTLDEGI